MGMKMGTGGNSVIEFNPDLDELVRQIRNKAGYYVHPETSMSSWIVGAAQGIAGLVTRKPSLSQYQESRIVEEALRLAGQSDVTWERYRGKYGRIFLERKTAQSAAKSLETGMLAYKEKINDPSIPKADKTSEALQYAKEKMAYEMKARVPPFKVI